MNDMNGNALAINDKVNFLDQRPGKGGIPQQGRILEFGENGWCAILCMEDGRLVEIHCPAHRMIKYA